MRIFFFYQVLLLLLLLFEYRHNVTTHEGTGGGGGGGNHDDDVHCLLRKNPSRGYHAHPRHVSTRRCLSLTLNEISIFYHSPRIYTYNCTNYVRVPYIRIIRENNNNNNNGGRYPRKSILRLWDAAVAAVISFLRATTVRSREVMLLFLFIFSPELSTRIYSPAVSLYIYTEYPTMFYKCKITLIMGSQILDRYPVFFFTYYRLPYE